MATCKRCGGSGNEAIYEDGRRFESACYHCANTGVVSTAEALEYAIESARLEIGMEKAQDERCRINSDPNGDGYGLCAAESGVSVSEYLHSRAWGLAGEVTREEALARVYQLTK